MRSPPRPDSRGFSLLEVAVAMAVLALVLAALAMPLASHVQARRVDEARHQLSEARDVVLGFAAAHGRLPCPATQATRGHEAFAPDGDPANGRCADFHGGYLPAASLGLAPLDDSGFLRDPWPHRANRVRYAVHSAGINGVPNALTRAGGMSQATLAALGSAPHYLYICLSGATVDAAGCGPAANQLTRRAAFLLLSVGPNAGTDAAPGSDEARNLDGDPVFVAREAAEGGFDDIVEWASIHLVVHRMVAAGRLP